jgi:hypothetical protein
MEVGKLQDPPVVDRVVAAPPDEITIATQIEIAGQDTAEILKTGGTPASTVQVLPLLVPTIAAAPSTVPTATQFMVVAQEMPRRVCVFIGATCAFQVVPFAVFTICDP